MSGGSTICSCRSLWPVEWAAGGLKISSWSGADQASLDPKPETPKLDVKAMERPSYSIRFAVLSAYPINISTDCQFIKECSMIV